LKQATHIQEFHLVIKYKKGSSNQMVELSSHAPICFMQILEARCSTYDNWKDRYATDSYFGPILDVLLQLTVAN